jgi:hypothetical protein
MSVIPITIFVSLLLTLGFVVLFAREYRRRPFASPERDSLLPLADETPRTVRDSLPEPAGSAGGPPLQPHAISPPS